MKPPIPPLIYRPRLPRSPPFPIPSLVQVYADRYLRLWDVLTGKCLLEVFTGHKLGESVISIAVDPAGQRIATADSAGFIKVGGQLPAMMPNRLSSCSIATTPLHPDVLSTLMVYKEILLI